jgi:hypothetical protein
MRKDGLDDLSLLCDRLAYFRKQLRQVRFAFRSWRVWIRQGVPADASCQQGQSYGC